nr:MAG TPA: hypothetical protein [Caudoviricetes sp.]
MSYFHLRHARFRSSPVLPMVSVRMVIQFS